MSNINNIISKYLGVPYKFSGNDLKGLDCINLCTLVGADRGVLIPNINHSSYQLHNYSGLFNIRDNNLLWEKTFAQSDVLVVFKINGIAMHVGYMLDDDQFIHILENSKVTVDRISLPHWEKRVLGFYTYIGTSKNI